ESQRTLEGGPCRPRALRPAAGRVLQVRLQRGEGDRPGAARLRRLHPAPDRRRGAPRAGAAGRAGAQRAARRHQKGRSQPYLRGVPGGQPVPARPPRLHRDGRARAGRADPRRADRRRAERGGAGPPGPGQPRLGRRELRWVALHPPRRPLRGPAGAGPRGDAPQRRVPGPRGAGPQPHAAPDRAGHPVVAAARRLAAGGAQLRVRRQDGAAGGGLHPHRAGHRGRAAHGGGGAPPAGERRGARRVLRLAHLPADPPVRAQRRHLRAAGRDGARVHPHARVAGGRLPGQPAADLRRGARAQPAGVPPRPRALPGGERGRGVRPHHLGARHHRHPLRAARQRLPAGGLPEGRPGAPGGDRGGPRRQRARRLLHLPRYGRAAPGAIHRVRAAAGGNGHGQPEPGGPRAAGDAAPGAHPHARPAAHQLAGHHPAAAHHA
ncbi:MAG: hypothetical protein AVDCRST_MAG68-3593, partial [uncultured Gemmatimonadetes bacterium]